LNVFVRLLVAALSALIIAFFGSYLIVVTQSSASTVPGPPFVYGSPTAIAP
jgi:hypothetical protein